MRGRSIDDRKITLEYLKANHVTFPIVLDTSPAARKAIDRYQALEDLRADPMTCIIGRDGKIVDGWFGYDRARTRAAVEKLHLEALRFLPVFRHAAEAHA